jgi:hypothetical protein
MPASDKAAEVAALSLSSSPVSPDTPTAIGAARIPPVSPRGSSVPKARWLFRVVILVINTNSAWGCDLVSEHFCRVPDRCGQFATMRGFLIRGRASVS